jgi:hypothetical protein
MPTHSEEKNMDVKTDTTFTITLSGQEAEVLLSFLQATFLYLKAPLLTSHEGWCCRPAFRLAAKLAEKLRIALKRS